jgi:hypothetical protein
MDVLVLMVLDVLLIGWIWRLLHHADAPLWLQRLQWLSPLRGRWLRYPLATMAASVVLLSVALVLGVDLVVWDHYLRVGRFSYERGSTNSGIGGPPDPPQWFSYHSDEEGLDVGVPPGYQRLALGVGQGYYVLEWW